MRNKNRRVRWAGIIFVMCLTAGIWNQTLVEASQETEVSETEVRGTYADEKETSSKDTELEEKNETESGESEIVPGERTAMIMVMSITGNKLTYYEVQEEAESEKEPETETQKVTEAGTTEESEELTEDREQEETEAESESANEKDMTPLGGMTQDGRNMTPPDGMTQDGENMTPPDGMAQDGGNMTPPDGMAQDGGNMTLQEGMSRDGRDMPSGDFQKGGRSEVQNDTKTVYLPVPVVVHTDTDERRTFSILEAGDKLHVTIVTDEEGNETITEIWMLGE